MLPAFRRSAIRLWRLSIGADRRKPDSRVPVGSRYNKPFHVSQGEANPLFPGRALPFRLSVRSPVEALGLPKRAASHCEEHLQAVAEWPEDGGASSGDGRAPAVESGSVPVCAVRGAILALCRSLSPPGTLPHKFSRARTCSPAASGCLSSHSFVSFIFC